jgi:hypothetical protein
LSTTTENVMKNPNRLFRFHIHIIAAMALVLFLGISTGYAEPHVEQLQASISTALHAESASEKVNQLRSALRLLRERPALSDEQQQQSMQDLSTIIGGVPPLAESQEDVTETDEKLYSILFYAVGAMSFLDQDMAMAVVRERSLSEHWGDRKFVEQMREHLLRGLDFKALQANLWVGIGAGDAAPPPPRTPPPTPQKGQGPEIAGIDEQRAVGGKPKPRCPITPASRPFDAHIHACSGGPEFLVHAALADVVMLMAPTDSPEEAES